MTVEFGQYHSTLLIVLVADEQVGGHRELIKGFQNPDDSRDVDQRAFARWLTELGATEPDRLHAIIDAGRSAKAVKHLLERTTEKVTIVWFATDQPPEDPRHRGDFLPMAEVLAVEFRHLFDQDRVTSLPPVALPSGSASSPLLAAPLMSGLDEVLADSSFDLVTFGNTGGGALRQLIVDSTEFVAPAWLPFYEFRPTHRSVDDLQLSYRPRTASPLAIQDLWRLLADSIGFEWNDLADELAQHLDLEKTRIGAAYRAVRAIRAGAEPAPADLQRCNAPNAGVDAVEQHLLAILRRAARTAL